MPRQVGSRLLIRLWYRSATERLCPRRQVAGIKLAPLPLVNICYSMRRSNGACVFGGAGYYQQDTRASFSKDRVFGVMAKKLVIVESPAKAKTIEKFLGRDFEVRASMGHIIDLPKRGLGVNTRKDFTPQYEIIEKKDKLIDDLKAASRRAEDVYLAPDPDREGEFIAWSLKETLGLKNPRRAVFNEITRGAVQQAIKKPREINEDLFNAQQARRVLDRLVGYKISPLLWRRIQSGTSAGRVQSVALRMICDREAEIRAFKPEEYWSITALLSKQRRPERFEAVLISRLNDMAAVNGEAGEEQGAAEEQNGANGTNGAKAAKREKGRIKISSKEEADTILAELQGAAYSVLKYEEREQRRQPYLPYTTSTMQQDASARLYFKPKKTDRKSVV